MRGVRALWAALWLTEPRLCWRHRLALARGRPDYADHGDPVCVRCTHVSAEFMRIAEETVEGRLRWGYHQP